MQQVHHTLHGTTTHLRTILAQSPVAIIELDATEMFGWTEQEALGRELPYLFPEEKGKRPCGSGVAARACPGTCDRCDHAGHGGPEIAERLRRVWPGLRMLFMSDYTDRMELVFLDEPETLCIQKPFLPDNLARRLRDLLDKSI